MNSLDTPVATRHDGSTMNARQAYNYFAHMRTNYRLIERSKYCSFSTQLDLAEDLWSFLEKGNLIYPPTLSRFGLGPNLTLAERKHKLSIEDKACLDSTPEELALNESLKHGGLMRRQQEWKWRIGNAAEEMNLRGWYPFFITLTVDPNRFDPEEIWSGREWTKMKRRMANVAAKSLGHEPPHKSNTPESAYMQYAGILEHGKSRNHHHMHALVWLREIPEDWKKCPNRGIRDPKKRTQRECRAFRTLWPFSLPGLSPAMYFRSVNDVWSKEGHIVPIDKKGKPMKMMAPGTAGAYIVKYLSKDHKEWQHRMKATRNLGMERLKTYLEKLTVDQLEPLTWRPPKYSTFLSTKAIHTVPQGLLRREAKLIHFAKNFRCNPLDLVNLMQSNSDYYLNMRQSVRDGARPDRMDSKELYDWLSELLPDITGYCEDRLLAEHRKLGVLFPKIKNQVIEPIPALEIN